MTHRGNTGGTAGIYIITVVLENKIERTRNDNFFFPSQIHDYASYIIEQKIFLFNYKFQTAKKVVCLLCGQKIALLKKN
jgi:hypothetical protein